MLACKKNRKDDLPTTNIKERATLISMWNARKNRPSPTASPTTSDDEEEMTTALGATHDDGVIRLKPYNNVDNQMPPDDGFV